MNSKKYYIAGHLMALLGTLLCFNNKLESQSMNLDFPFNNNKIEFFLHVPILFETTFKRTDPVFPSGVLNLVEERSEKTPLSAALGLNVKIEKGFLQTGIGYWKIPYRQKIEVMADQGDIFSIERSISHESVALPVVFLIRSEQTPRLGVYAGLEFRILREKWEGEEQFIFKQLEDLNNSSLINELNLQQNERETIAFRRPTMPIQGFWYWDIQFKLGITYRLPITSNLALDFNASWVPPVHLSKNNQFKVNTLYANEDWWGDHYYLKNDGKHLNIREYLGISFIYTFNQKDRILKKIGVK